MAKTVLVADDDQELLLVLKEGMEKYKEEFNVLLAGDGQAAIQKLESNSVSLVVADLKMPGMDGFSLLARISEYYPDIPVIIITAYGSDQMREMVHQNGAAGYLEKPFMIDDLVREMRSVLEKEAEGGTLHGISLAMFLQLIDMEQKTCTLRVHEKRNGYEGVLFFNNGELMEARTGGQHGEEAVYTILSWDDVLISIQNTCSIKERKIQKDSQALLMDAMRLKDESQEQEAEDIEIIEETDDSEKSQIKEDVKYSAQSESGVKIENVQSRIEHLMGEKSGVRDIYQDESYDSVLDYGSKLAEVFGGGRLRLAFFEDTSGVCKYLIPAQNTTVISVEPNSPREKMIQILRA
jgi:CheY-like chemotaxis protein